MHVSTVENGLCITFTMALVWAFAHVMHAVRSAVMKIDWEKLGELEDWNTAWRSTLDSGLSTRYVPGEGDNPQVMIIGEAPGAQEDAALRPFVGASGRVLRDLMTRVGLYTKGCQPKREFICRYDGKLSSHHPIDRPGVFHCITPEPKPNCWLTNTVHFRPPGNRNPSFQEIHIARSGLYEEWVAIGQPDIIIPVGGIALRAVKGTQYSSIFKVAGTPLFHTSRDGRDIVTWPMVHPSYGIRNKPMIPTLEGHWKNFKRWFADPRLELDPRDIPSRR